jgi:tripartite-type tricarboxylate transporter receptor subunit TctC
MQETRRRKTLLSVVVLLSALLCPQVAPAQEYPTKPITFVVPFGPGGDSDLSGRVLGSVAVDYLGQPMLIQLKPGGQGIIGTEQAAKAPPDGYTLLAAGSGWNSALPAIEGRSKGPDDMEAVCRINYNSTLLCVRPDSPFKTFKQLLEYVKANPGKLLTGVGGPYTPHETFWRYLMKQMGISVRILSFDGGAQMVLAALGGHIDVTGGTPQMLASHIKAGKLVPLIYLDKARSQEHPNVPTATEEGINFTCLQWRGIIAPKATPRPVIDKLGSAFKKMTEDASVKAMMEKTGQGIQYLGPDEFAKFWRADYELYKELKGLFKK